MILKDELLSDLILVANQMGTDSLSHQQYKQNGGIYHHAEFYKTYRGWDNCLIAAGLKPYIQPMRPIMSRNQLIGDIKRVAKEMNTTMLTFRKYSEHSDVENLKHVQVIFGSWNKAVEAAGLVPNLKKKKLMIEKKVLVQDIIRVAKQLNKKNLTVKEYRTHGKPGYFSVIVKEFKTWYRAITEAGLEPFERKRKVSNNEMITELKRIFEPLKTKKITIKNYVENSGKYNVISVIRRFGTWQKALIAAGLKEKQKQEEEDD